jgi:hypothetical protein
MQQGKRVAHLAQPGEFQHYLPVDIHYYQSIHTEMHPPITVVSSAHNVFTTKHTLLSLGIRGSQGCHPRTIYLLDIHYYHSIHTEMHPPITVVSSVNRHIVKLHCSDTVGHGRPAATPADSAHLVGPTSKFSFSDRHSLLPCRQISAAAHDAGPRVSIVDMYVPTIARTQLLYPEAR